MYFNIFGENVKQFDLEFQDAHLITGQTINSTDKVIPSGYDNTEFFEFREC